MVTTLIIVFYILPIILTILYGKFEKDYTALPISIMPIAGVLVALTLLLSSDSGCVSFRKKLAETLNFTITDNTEAKRILKDKINAAKQEYRETVRKAKQDAERTKLLAKLGLTEADLEKIKKC